jgi:hypothetical protein
MNPLPIKTTPLVGPRCEHRWKDHPEGPYCVKCKQQPSSPAEALNAYQELVDAATSFTWGGKYTIKRVGVDRTDPGHWLVVDDEEHWCGMEKHVYRDLAFAEAMRLERGDQEPA